MSIKRRVKRTTHYISAYTLKHAFILPNVGFPVEQRSPRLLNINEFRLNNSEDGLKPENRYDSKYFEYIEGLKKQGLVQGFMPTVNSHQESIIPSQKRPQYPKKLDKCIPIPEFKSLNNEYLKKLGDYLLHSCKDNHSSLVVNLLENLDINSNLSQLQLYPFKVYLKYHDLDEISEQLSKIPQLEKYYLRRILQTKNDALIYKNISRLTADKDCWLGVLEWMIARKRFFEKQTELVSKLLHKGGCKRLVGLVIEYLHSSNSDWTAVAQTCTKFGFTPIVQQTIMKLVDASGSRENLMLLMMLTTLLKRTSKMTNEYSNYIVRALASHGELWSCLEFAKDNNVNFHTKTVNYCWSMLDAPKTVANTFEKQDLIREMWHILKAHNHQIFMNVLGTATRENNAWLLVQLVECIPSYPKHHQTFMYEKVFDIGQRGSIDISKLLHKHWKLSTLRNDPRSFGWHIGWIKHKQSLLKNLEIFLAELAKLGPFPVEFEEMMEAMSARVGVELEKEMREAVRDLARPGVDIE